jgi:hypothetical protein
VGRPGATVPYTTGQLAKKLENCKRETSKKDRGQEGESVDLGTKRLWEIETLRSEIQTREARGCGFWRNVLNLSRFQKLRPVYICPYGTFVS